MKNITHMEYVEALERVEEVMNELEHRFNPALEREMVELNLLIDSYEAQTERAS